MPGEIKVTSCTEMGVSLGYCLIMAATSIWAIHLNFSFFYATKDTLDKEESSFVTQITVVYLIAVTLINCFANSLGFFNQRKRAFLIGLTLAIIADIGFTVCYFYDVWNVAKGVLFICLLANGGIINPSAFSLIAETVSS